MATGLDTKVPEVRGELDASLHDLVGKALAVVETLLGCSYDPSIRLRTSVALLNMAGVGMVQKTRRGSGRSMAATGSSRSDDAAAAGLS
jgi:hypothetical protein